MLLEQFQDFCQYPIGLERTQLEAVSRAASLPHAVIVSGLAQAVGFAFSANTGKLLENLAFLALRRRTREIYYYLSPAGYEVGRRRAS